MDPMDVGRTALLDEFHYPESDGKPMADNTLQWDWMVKIVGELREMFAGQNVFVGGDLFWYPVERSMICQAPDALVAFGRPPGYRGSYLQWLEDGIAPQVVFEILSPSNTHDEMGRKLAWYDRYGVEEYYFIDPYENRVEGWLRRDGKLESIDTLATFESPRLGIRFEVNGEVKIFTPKGREFKTREERVAEFEEEWHKRELEFGKQVAKFEEELHTKDLAIEAERIRAIQAEARTEEAKSLAREAKARAEAEKAIADEAKALAKLEKARAEAEKAIADEAKARAEAEKAARDLLLQRLRELGIDPEELLKSPQ